MTTASPRANVEIVQQVYAAFHRRDTATVDRLFATDAVLEQSPEVPWGGRYVGHAEIHGFFAELVGAIRSAVTFERFVDAGADVVALGRTRGTVLATGREFDVPVAHVWTLRDGLVVRAHFMIDNPSMLAALA